MKIAICDDDWHMQQTLRAFIDQTFQDLDMLVDGFTSGEALVAAIHKQTQPYDLVLLDIEMIGMNGIETAKKVRQFLPECYIIFITSHDEFALTRYEVAAFRYLVKPLQPEKLAEAISAVRDELADQFMLHVEDKDIEAVVRAKDVFYIEAQDKRVCLVLKDTSFYDRKGLDAIAELLKHEDFYRVHRSYLINMRYVAFIDKSAVQMVNGAQIPLSRLRRKQCKTAFQAYVSRTARG